MLDKYKRLEGETFEEYEYRICQMNARTGELETWNDVVDVINEAWGTNYTECKVRKDWNTFQKMLPAYQKQCADGEEMLEEIKEERRALERERVKFRDERNEVSRILRTHARIESLKDMVKECAQEFAPIPCRFVPDDTLRRESQTVVAMVSDLHAGLKAENCLNTYDESILQARMSAYFRALYRINEVHAPEECVVVLCGDLINGVLRTANRLENNQNVIRQTIFVSDLLSQFISSLAGVFPAVRVYGTPGNHGRVFQSKDEAVDGENFDVLVMYILEAKLKEFENVHVKTQNLDETFGVFNCYGRDYVFAHGEKENVDTAATKFAMILGHKPTAILLGHRHSNGFSTSYDCKVVQSGTGAGTDRYAIDHRLHNAPEQMAFLCGENGITCYYDIKLNK